MKRILTITALLCVQGLIAGIPAPTAITAPAPVLPVSAETLMPAAPTETVVEESLPATAQAEPAVVETAVETAPSVTTETVIAPEVTVPEKRPAAQKVEARPEVVKKEMMGKATIAVLTMDKLMMGNKRYAAEVGPMRKEVEARSEALKRRAADLEDARRTNKKAPADFAKDEANLRIDFQAFNNEMQEREQKLQMSIMKAASEAVESVAKEMGVDIVFPKTLYAAEKFDITDKVLTAMNKAYDAEVAASKFKKAQEDEARAPQAVAPKKAAAPAASAAKPAAKKAAPKVKAPTKSKAA